MTSYTLLVYLFIVWNVAIISLRTCKDFKTLFPICCFLNCNIILMGCKHLIVFPGWGSFQERLQYLFLKHYSSIGSLFPFIGYNSHLSIQAWKILVFLCLILSCGQQQGEAKVNLGWWCQNLLHSTVILQMLFWTVLLVGFFCAKSSNSALFFATSVWIIDHWLASSSSFLCTSYSKNLRCNPACKFPQQDGFWTRVVLGQKMQWCLDVFCFHPDIIFL